MLGEERGAYAREGGSLLCPSSPEGEGNWDGSGDREGGPKAKKEGGRFPRPCPVCFSPSNRQSGTQAGRVQPAGAAVPAAPRGASETRNGILPVQD